MYVSMKDRSGAIERTSSGAAEYSVLGSLASSRASCMMRLTAEDQDHERRMTCQQHGEEKEDSRRHRGAHRSCSCLAGEGRPFERVRRRYRGDCGRRKGVSWSWHDLGFYFRHTWRLAARAASNAPGPSPSRLRSTPTLSAHQTRRDRTTACHILSIRFNAARLIARKKDTQLPRYTLFFFVFVASCRSRNSKFAHKRVRAPTLSLPFIPFPSCFILSISELQHPLIHSVLIPCHRPACGALRPTTRVNARMLGRHERCQINRGLSRACSGTL